VILDESGDDNNVLLFADGESRSDVDYAQEVATKVKLGCSYPWSLFN
jgi:hypothetical protein